MKTIDNHLETAYLDWSSVRTQMVVGMLAVFCLCLVNFLLMSQLSGAGNGLQHPDYALCPGLLNGLQIIDFLLYFASCLLTALIASEITAHFGNRMRASCSIWSALLFAVLQISTITSFPTVIVARVVSFFVLLAVFLFLRTKENKELVLLLALLAFCLGIYLNSRFGPGFSLLAFSQMFFPNGISSIGRTESYLLVGACLIAGMNLLIRIALRTIDFEAIGVCFGCLLLAIILANFKIFDYSIWQKEGLTSFNSPSMILARSAFAIGFSLCCLPGIDSANIKLNRLIGSMGLIALIVVAVVFQKLFTS